MIPDTPITLALDTTSGGFAFAVLQGSETLLDWGCSDVDTRTPEAWRARVDKLLARYEPELLVLPEVPDLPEPTWAARFTTDLASLASETGMVVRRVSRHEVREMFEDFGTTKNEIAVAISRFFPELEPRLPPERRPWMSEDSRMSIFDAVSFALVALRQPAEE